MSIRKKLCIILTSVLIFSIAAVATAFIIYFANTMSVDDCIDFCIQNSYRKATDFECLGDGRYIKRYMYWIATNGDSSKPQEIFVFREKYFGLLKLNRFQFVVSSDQSDVVDGGNGAGSIKFFTKNDDNKTEKDATIICYGAKADSNITRYEYTLTNREGSNVFSGNVANGERVWSVKFFDINDIDDNSKKVISDIKFYDDDNNLICTIK